MLDDLREMTVRDRYPVIGQLKCDTSGNLFVEEYVRPGAESRYVVSFSPDGLLRGVSELPAAYRLLGVHNDALILLTTDDLGIESVEVRELRREEGRGLGKSDCRGFCHPALARPPITQATPLCGAARLTLHSP